MKPIRYPGGLNKSWSMTCGKCGKECSPTLANLKRGQGPCKNCCSISESFATRFMNDIHPHLELGTYPGSANKRWQIQCKRCGNQFARPFQKLKVRKEPCARCAGQKPFSNFEARQYLQTFHPNLVPLEDYPGKTGDRWRILCTNCDEVKLKTFSDMKRSEDTGCRTCIAGFYTYKTIARDKELKLCDSNLYFVDIRDGNNKAIKVGVGQKRRARRIEGKLLIAVPCPLMIAYVYEQKILSENPKYKMINKLKSGNTEVVQYVSDATQLLKEVEHLASTSSLWKQFDQDNYSHIEGYEPISI